MCIMVYVKVLNVFFLSKATSKARNWELLGSRLLPRKLYQVFKGDVTGDDSRNDDF